MAKEGAHEKGRDGALRAKRWLESTTRVRISWDAYNSAAQTTLPRPDGSEQTFDLKGELVFPQTPPKPLFVECKNYTTQGAQTAAYREYLADAYFGTLHLGADYDAQFMWLTWHPFNLAEWSNLCGPLELTSAEDHASLDATAKLIESAVSASAFRGNHEVDGDLCRVVAQRLWLIVLSQRQETRLTIDPRIAAGIRDGLLGVVTSA